MSKVQSFFERRKKNAIKASFHMAAAVELTADSNLAEDEPMEEEKSEHEFNENTEWKVEEHTTIETVPIASAIALKLVKNNELGEATGDKNRSKVAWSRNNVEPVLAQKAEPEKKIWVPSFKNRMNTSNDANPNLLEASAMLANRKKETSNKKKVTKLTTATEVFDDSSTDKQVVKVKFDVFELLGPHAPTAKFKAHKVSHQLVADKYKGRPINQSWFAYD